MQPICRTRNPTCWFLSIFAYDCRWSGENMAEWQRRVTNFGSIAYGDSAKSEILICFHFPQRIIAIGSSPAGIPEMYVMAVPLVCQLALTGSDLASTSDKRIGAGGGSSSPEGTSRSSRSSSRSRKQPRLIPTVIIDESPLFRAGLVHILAGS